jgi:type I restriction enzyme S subunit
VDGPYAIFDQEVVIGQDFSSPRNYVNLAKSKKLERFKVRPGDVLVTGRGTIGRAVVAPTGIRVGVIHPCLLRVRTDYRRLVPEFLVAYLRWSSRAQEELSLQSSATTIEVIYSSTLREMRIPDVPVWRQTELLGRIRKVVQLHELVIEGITAQMDLLKERRQALITAAVTGRLDIPGAA